LILYQDFFNQETREMKSLKNITSY